MRVQCPMCLEEFTPEDDLQCPPCGHVFHRHCVQEWFDCKRAGGDRPDCPQCRKVTNVNKLMKIYPAEAECDSHDDREKDLYRQIEEIKYKLEFKEGENNSLIDKVEDLESRLNEKAEQLNKSQIETNRNKKDKKVLNQKLQKLESEREEIGNKYSNNAASVILEYIFIVTVVQCFMAFLLYLCGSEEWFHSLVSHIMGILGSLFYCARFAPGKK